MMVLDDFFDFDHAKAQVFLHKEGDGKNMALVSDSQILFVYKGRRHLFLIDKVQELRAETQKQLLALIVGGIIAPFAFLSFFIHPLQPWIHLLAIIIGLYLLYIGYAGKPAVVVKLKNKEELVIILPAVSLQIDAFLEYTNAILSHGNSTAFHSFLYLDVSEGMEEVIFSETKSESAEFPIFAFTYAQLPPAEKRQGIILAFDPVTCGREITFQYDTSSNMLRPVVSGQLQPDSRAALPPWIK